MRPTPKAFRLHIGLFGRRNTGTSSLLNAMTRQEVSLVSEVAADTPPGVPLTSFSILFARHKGDLAQLVAGAAAIDRLRPGDRVLVAEACTHHPVDDDIGRVKIPRNILAVWSTQPRITRISRIKRSFPCSIRSADSISVIREIRGLLHSAKQLRSRDG